MTSQARILWRALRVVLGLIAMALVLAYPRPAAAEPQLVYSDPADEAMRAATPAAVRLLYDEPIEPRLSWARLYRADGSAVSLPPSQVGIEARQLILALPNSLSFGDYTVQWQAVSAEDGTATGGYYVFRIGSHAPSPPEGPPLPSRSAQDGWLEIAGRSIVLFGLLVACGAVVAWNWVLQGALRTTSDEGYRRAAQRVTWLAIGGLGLALAGGLPSLAGEVLQQRDAVTLDGIRAVLTTTRFGQLWLAGVGLQLCLGMLLGRALWRGGADSLRAGLGLSVLAGLVLVPPALDGHAAELAQGRAAAFASNWLHLAAAASIVGGLLAAISGLRATSGASADQIHHTLYSVVLQRWTTLAMCAVAILLITGFYEGWLHAGNLTALMKTDYGIATQLKLAALIALLALAGLTLGWIAPGRRALRCTTVAGLVFAIAMVVPVAWMTALPSGRDAVLAAVDRYTMVYQEQDLQATLFISPSAAGLNRYTVDLGAADEEQLEDARVVLRATPTAPLYGTHEIPLERVELQGGFARYEASSRDLSVAGRWSVELIIQRSGLGEIRTTDELTVTQVRPADSLPASPPLFVGALAPVCVLLAGGAVVGAIAGVRWKGDPLRGRQVAVSSAGLLTFATLGLAFAFTS